MVTPVRQPDRVVNADEGSRLGDVTVRWHAFGIGHPTLIDTDDDLQLRPAD
jgi:hypothetical protein